MTMVAQLLKGIELAPGQLAELRAINSLYYTQLARKATVSSVSSSALYDLVLTRVREMLLGEQQISFDRNRAACELDEARNGARTERYL